ncbi:hypothetical protein ACKC9G_03410 [Pokkaliibacter sp. CJK22405]|uniref:hypothetical protein n=1 Tax=Pokkaliibacter sp. CJK22405 TaxID=3384615 RepID=UPI003984954A
MKVYLVGGAVRDRLLQRPVKERDWVVVGETVESMLAQGFEQVGKDFPVFLHPQTHEEYALARTERKSGQGYTGFVCHASPDITLEEDLRRRDLTINAMAEDADGQIIDPYGGLADLESGTLRHVSEAFIEDPLRVLRVARFAARYHYLGFMVARETLALMQNLAGIGELEALVPERIWKETERVLMDRDAPVYFDVLALCGALPHLLSGLEELPDLTRHDLNIAHELNLDLTQRGALLLQAQKNEADWASALRMPTAIKQLADLLRDTVEQLEEAQSPAEQLSLIEKTDALRRPERFIALLECIAVMMADDGFEARSLSEEWKSLWQRRINTLKALDIGALAKSGVKGDELIARIREMRLAALAH